MTTEELKAKLDGLHTLGGLNVASRVIGGSDGAKAAKDAREALTEPILAAFAALEQRAEDAELIAWGFQSGRIRAARTFETALDQFPDIHWFAETGTMHKYECHDLGPSTLPPTLTPAAREALRQAKEQSK